MVRDEIGVRTGAVRERAVGLDKSVVRFGVVGYTWGLDLGRLNLFEGEMRSRANVFTVWLCCWW